MCASQKVKHQALVILDCTCSQETFFYEACLNSQAMLHLTHSNQIMNNQQYMYYILNINIVKHHRYWKVQSTSFQSVQTEACLLKTTAVLSAAKPYHSVSLLI